MHLTIAYTRLSSRDFAVKRAQSVLVDIFFTCKFNTVEIMRLSYYLKDLIFLNHNQSWSLTVSIKYKADQFFRVTLVRVYFRSVLCV